MTVRVEVLGPGCRRCTKLLELVRDVALDECPGVEARYVTDPVEIVRRGFFMRTPALVIDGTVVAAGRVPSRREISTWLAPHHIPLEVHP
ncbi:MAG TPA: thioredoxin family protein [Candidatus Limnocylindrales bacterium]